MLKPFSSGETGANQVEANSDARKTETLRGRTQRRGDSAGLESGWIVWGLAEEMPLELARKVSCK